MAEIDPRSGSEHNWTVKLRLAIDADDESEARAIAGKVIHAMDVVANELQVTHSASRRPFWDIVTDLDLSPAGNVTPDDALTRFRYVIRKLPGVTFMSPRGQDARTGLYQWLPDEWNTAKNYEELAHPAVRARGIYVSADPGQDRRTSETLLRRSEGVYTRDRKWPATPRHSPEELHDRLLTSRLVSLATVTVVDAATWLLTGPSATARSRRGEPVAGEQ